MPSATLVAPQQGLIRKTVAVDALKSKARAGERVLRFLITSDALDRDREVVIPAGMRYDEYLRNPVLVWAHKHDQLPIGKCVGIEPARGGRALVGDFEFARHQFADDVFNLYKEDVLRAVSVGFRALVAGPPSAEMVATRPELTKCYRVITASNLFEVSAVPIPSNPEALREATLKGLRVPAQVWDGLASSAPHVKLGVRTGSDVAEEVAQHVRAALPDMLQEAVLVATARAIARLSGR